MAYGILVQLAIEQHFSAIKELLPLFRRLGLPTNFHDLHLDNINDEGINKMAALSADKSTTMSSIPLDIDDKTVRQAILSLETIAISV